MNGACLLAPSVYAAQAAAAAGVTAAPGEDEDVDLHFVAFVHKNGEAPHSTALLSRAVHLTKSPVAGFVAPMRARCC